MRFRRFAAALAAAALAAASLFSATAATAAPAPQQHQAAPARLGAGPWNIKETNGSFWVGASDITAGNPVTEKSEASARNMTWDANGGTYQGHPTGYWKFSNGNFIATTVTDCEVTVKSSSSSTGTVWADNGNLIINRYCDQQVGSNPDTQALAGFNISGRQFTVCGLPYDCSGFYRAMSFY